MPSTALDVAGLLRTAIRCDDPVMFLEHKHLYRQPYNRSENPGPDFTIPLARPARSKRAATSASSPTAPLVHRAEVAAAQFEREGISVEIVDLRSLSPYDWEAIAATRSKTHRVIVAYEDTLSWGYGAEIAARIADELSMNWTPRSAASPPWNLLCLPAKRKMPSFPRLATSPRPSNSFWTIESIRLTLFREGNFFDTFYVITVWELGPIALWGDQ